MRGGASEGTRGPRGPRLGGVQLGGGIPDKVKRCIPIPGLGFSLTQRVPSVGLGTSRSYFSGPGVVLRPEGIGSPSAM